MNISQSLFVTSVMVRLLLEDCIELSLHSAEITSTSDRVKHSEWSLIS